MIRRPGAWRIAAIVFTIVNVAGGVYAAQLNEPMHAAVHAALTLVGAYAMFRLVGPRGSSAPQSLPHDAARLEELQSAVDAVALEVERIGEAQRFEARLRARESDAPR